VEDEKEKMFKRVAQRRGFRFGIHDFLAEVYPDLLPRINDYVEYTYLRDQLLDRKTRELCLIAALCAIGGDHPKHIELHMKAAVVYGATKEEILEEIILLSYWLGGGRYPWAFEAWREAFRPDLPTIMRITDEPHGVD